jgi:hypothetical protein
MHTLINYIESLPLGISTKVLSERDVGFFPFSKNTNNSDLKFETLDNMELHHKIQLII